MTQYADIFDAIEKRDIEAVKSFLPEQLEARGRYDETPLHCACQNGYTEIVRLLLDNGADIEAKDEDGFEPLHMACNYGRHEVSELLVKNGADPLSLDYYEREAFACDIGLVKDKDGNKIPHKEILARLRTEYLNKHALDASERTNTLSSGWEMEW